MPRIVAVLLFGGTLAAGNPDGSSLARPVRNVEPLQLQTESRSRGLLWLG